MDYQAAWQQTIAAYRAINPMHPAQRAKFCDFADGVLTLEVNDYVAIALEGKQASVCHEFSKYSEVTCHSLALINHDAPSNVIALSPHQQAATTLSEAEELKRLRAENAELKSRLVATENRMKSYRALAADSTTPSEAEGYHLGFLLPYLPEMPYLQAKAILTLLALGGSVKMKAVEFARLMGKTGNTASYKRLFAGVEGVVIFDGKNLRLAQVPFEKLALSASFKASDETPENENLRLAQETKEDNLRNSQEIPENLRLAQEILPSYDDDDIYQNTSIENISSSRQAVARNEVLVFARERLAYNIKYPPDNLNRHTPVNAIALVLQAFHSNANRSKAGLWKTMVNNEQPAEQRWLDEAWRYLSNLEREAI